MKEELKKFVMLLSCLVGFYISTYLYAISTIIWLFPIGIFSFLIFIIGMKNIEGDE